MLNNLITSRTRIRLLKKFFLNSSTKAHLRGLATEFGESSNSIRLELNRFEKAGLLTSFRDKNRKLYQANKNHPFYNDIHNIVMKETGLDTVIDKVIQRAGKLLSVYLTGDFACGRDGNVIELVLVGSDIDTGYLGRKVMQAEDITGRKVNYTLCHPDEAERHLNEYKPEELLLLWQKD